MATIAHSSIDREAEMRNAQASLIDEARIADSLEMPALAARCRCAADWYGRQLRRLADGFEVASNLPEIMQ